MDCGKLAEKKSNLCRNMPLLLARTSLSSFRQKASMPSNMTGVALYTMGGLRLLPMLLAKPVLYSRQFPHAFKENANEVPLSATLPF